MEGLFWYSPILHSSQLLFNRALYTLILSITEHISRSLSISSLVLAVPTAVKLLAGPPMPDELQSTRRDTL
jgi:hypothetical protein